MPILVNCEILLPHLKLIARGLQQQISLSFFFSAKSTQRKVSDIISILVNVYGSQDLFVNEYRTLLADRLLTQLNYHTEREIRHLELLKRRFDENQLHYCEVMLKDVYDSKRIDGNIHSDTSYNLQRELFPTSALILSAQFWPPFKEDWKLKLPTFVQNQLNKYVKAFETLKGNRTLCWKPHLGNVSLEIELKDRKLDINVTPVHATIILHFQDKSKETEVLGFVVVTFVVVVVTLKMIYRRVGSARSSGGDARAGDRSSA